jgi:exonuclease VII large subunit
MPCSLPIGIGHGQRSIIGLQMTKLHTSVGPERSAFARAPVARLSVRTLATLLDKAATEAFADVVGSRYGLVHAKGRISRLPEARYNRLYDVALEEDGSTVYLEIPKALADERGLSSGDYVGVTGRLSVNARWEGIVKMRVDVCQLELIDSPEEVERKRSEALALQRVRDLRSTRSPFPFKPELAVTVICAVKGQVLSDFLGAISGVKSMLKVTEVSVPMDSASEIASAIQSSKADILVLIRGGGSAEGFAVLDDARVVEALGANEAFRVVGTGHAVHSGILDLVADYASNTPADAGTFIARQIGAYFTLREVATKEIERLRNEHSTVAGSSRLRDVELGELRAKLAAMQSDASKERAGFKKLAWLTAGLTVLLALAISQLLR